MGTFGIATNLIHTATHCNTLQHSTTHCNTPRGKERRGNSGYCDELNSHCNTLQHSATLCNTPRGRERRGNSWYCDEFGSLSPPSRAPRPLPAHIRSDVTCIRDMSLVIRGRESCHTYEMSHVTHGVLTQSLAPRPLPERPLPAHIRESSHVYRSCHTWERVTSHMRNKSRHTLSLHISVSYVPCTSDMSLVIRGRESRHT